jgi:hypothetical protein
MKGEGDKSDMLEAYASTNRERESQRYQLVVLRGDWLVFTSKIQIQIPTHFPAFASFNFCGSVLLLGACGLGFLLL